eukprot:TRINITY_DN15551_c0_g1_i1.p1 TRINITY_DN15551_c0_g1~~TRINITY_DN15551_c0_g1_i1.p1  ORF type:complete len:114 (+),score=41.82 TRINITY_DN15551_c0_g1_i1:200-541(+)
MATSAPGKHGHAKVHIVGYDIFTGKKYEEATPATHNVQVPEVTKTDYLVMGESYDHFMSLLSIDGRMKQDLRMPGDVKLAGKIRAGLDAGRDVTVTVLGAVEQEIVIFVKDAA